MKRMRTLLFSLVLIAAAAPAAYPECLHSPAPGPSIMHDLLYDASFAQDCDAWVLTGGVEKVSGGAEFSDIGSAVQEIEVDSSGEFDISVSVQVLYQGNSNDRLYVELVSANGTLLETVASFTRSTGTGTYHFDPVNNYNGQTIKFRLRYFRGPFGGGTVFKVSEVHHWVFNV